MRKELNNTFTDGLIKDLNPINTPNTVLTDCLNGTILTYNGNEYSLQNDMGNYALEHCKLPENYVPVAIKEYGDILYILSYNPIAKKTQIGSYPSIRQIIKNRDDSGQNPVKALPYTDESINYTEIVDNNEITIIYDDEYKINPGDKIQITESSSSNEGAPEFTTTRYYIMDSDKILYDITDQISKFITTQKPELITWQMPGWLCAKIVPFKLDKCDIVVGSNSYYNQITKTGELHLKYIAESSDKNFNDKYYNDSPYTFSVDVTYDDQVNPSSTYPKRFNKRVDYDSSMVYYTNDDSKSISINNNNPNPIKVTVTPKLVTNGKTLKYDNLTVTKEFPLGTSIDINEVKLGEDVWKWDVSQDYITLHLSISDLSSFGLPNAGSEIQLWYKIYKYDYDPDDSNMLENDYLCITSTGDSFSFGQTIDLNVDFDSGIDPKFKKENIYLVHFWIGPENDSESDTTNYPHVWKPLITSDIFNSMAESRYDELYLDDWVNKKLNSLTISAALQISNEGQIIESDTNLKSGIDYDRWIKDESELINPEMKAFVPNSLISDYDALSDLSNDTCTITKNLSAEIKVVFDHPDYSGDLWSSLQNNCTYYCNDSQIENNTFYQYEIPFVQNIDCTYSKLINNNFLAWKYSNKKYEDAMDNILINCRYTKNYQINTALQLILGVVGIWFPIPIGKEGAGWIKFESGTNSKFIEVEKSNSGNLLSIKNEYNVIKDFVNNPNNTFNYFKNVGLLLSRFKYQNDMESTITFKEDAPSFAGITARTTDRTFTNGYEVNSFDWVDLSHDIKYNQFLVIPYKDSNNNDDFLWIDLGQSSEITPKINVQDYCDLLRYRYAELDKSDNHTGNFYSISLTPSDIMYADKFIQNVYARYDELGLSYNGTLFTEINLKKVKTTLFEKHSELNLVKNIDITDSQILPDSGKILSIRNAINTKYQEFYTNSNNWNTVSQTCYDNYIGYLREYFDNIDNKNKYYFYYNYNPNVLDDALRLLRGDVPSTWIEGKLVAYLTSNDNGNSIKSIDQQDKDLNQAYYSAVSMGNSCTSNAQAAITTAMRNAISNAQSA